MRHTVPRRWFAEVLVHLGWLVLGVLGVMLAAWFQTRWAGSFGASVVVGWNLLALFEVLWPLLLGAASVWTLWRWSEEGTWNQLMAWGMGGREMGRFALALGTAGLGVGLVLCHGWGPMCRSQARDAGMWVQWPGPGPVQLGDWTIWPQSVDGAVASDVYLRRDGMEVWAETAELVWMDEAPGVRWTQGRAELSSGPRLRFESWTHSLVPGQRRVQLNERSSGDLARVASRTAESGGRSAYEWSVLYKRWTWPLVALLAPWALVPWSLRRRVVSSSAVTLLGALLMVRVGDGFVASVGPLVASCAAPFWVAAIGCWGWVTWRDR